MKRLIVMVSGLLFGFLGWSLPGLAQSTTVTFQQGQNGYTGTMDTYIDQFTPTDFYGGVERIEVRSYDSGSGLSEKQNTLLRFGALEHPQQRHGHERHAQALQLPRHCQRRGRPPDPGQGDQRVE